MQSKSVSLSNVLQILKQQTVSVDRSQSQEAVFYVVPRANFPKGLSPEQQKWMVTGEEVAQRYEMRDDDTDYDNVYLFMDACPRASLGKWIHQLRFSKVPRNAAIENNMKASASSSVSANDGHEDEVPPPPPVKKRHLQKQLSDSSSDQEEKTLLEMINTGPYLQHRQNKHSHIALLGERGGIRAEAELWRTSRHGFLRKWEEKGVVLLTG